MSPGAFVLLSLLSLGGFGRHRSVPMACDRGVVAYRFEAEAGTLITYAGVTHRIDASGSLELLADRDTEVIRVGARRYTLPLYGKPDAFGVLTVRLAAR